MNYYDFVNSKDVRAYLQNINYNFLSVEKAWLVFNSKKPKDIKIMAMNYILSTTNDCIITVDNHLKYEGSLHYVIKKNIEKWKSAEHKNACDDSIMSLIFRYIDVDFPIPFKKGDILKYFDSSYSCPISFLQKEKGSHFKETAMCPGRIFPSASFVGYFSAGTLERAILDCRDNYMNLEYYSSC